MRFLFEPSVGRSLTSPKSTPRGRAERVPSVPQCALAAPTAPCIRASPATGRPRPGRTARPASCMMGLVDGSELAHIGLGANLGPARRTLTRAVAELRSLPGASLEGVSRLYRTRPVGPVAQGHFLNAAVALRVPAGADAERGAMALLLALKLIERSLGRQARERWGPREMDLDLLLFGAHRLRVERIPAARSGDSARGDAQWLEVPHPLARDRLFVLAPLADLAPDLRPPTWDQTVVESCQRRRAVEGNSVRCVAEWMGSEWQTLGEEDDHRPWA